MLSAVSAAKINIKTNLPQTILIADGVTQYTLEVRANTTEFPGTLFNTASWDVVVPSYITITGAQLPSLDNPSTNIDDFFYNKT